MSGLLGALLVTGSQIRVGFEVDAAYGDPVAAKDTIEGCLYQSGAFASVTADIHGGFFNDYITIEGVTAFDFSQPEDIGGYVQGMIQACLPVLTIKRRDPVVIEAIPQSAAGSADIAQPNAGMYSGAPQAHCDWNAMTLGDYLACQTGFTKTTAVVAGIAVGVVLLFAVGRAAR